VLSMVCDDADEKPRGPATRMVGGGLILSVCGRIEQSVWGSAHQSGRWVKPSWRVCVEALSCALVSAELTGVWWMRGECRATTDLDASTK